LNEPVPEEVPATLTEADPVDVTYVESPMKWASI
jgi:hypothetical protein